MLLTKEGILMHQGKRRRRRETTLEVPGQDQNRFDEGRYEWWGTVEEGHIKAMKHGSLPVPRLTD